MQIQERDSRLKEQFVNCIIDQVMTAEIIKELNAIKILARSQANGYYHR